jgi:glyoxylase I family protein
MLERYSKQRVSECRNTLLLSRHLGRMRNGLPLAEAASAASAALGAAISTRAVLIARDFEKAVRAAGLPTRTLPNGNEFAPVWQFVDKLVPPEDRGFFLERQEVVAVPDDGRGEGENHARVRPSLAVKCLNHVSIETRDVERLRVFYSQMLGLRQLERPDFGFGGAWFQLSQGVALHIIERDPLKPGSGESEGSLLEGDSDESPQIGAAPSKVPEKFIRRSFHTALTVVDIDEAKRVLDEHSIRYAVNTVPGTSISQLFFYDPDGNGVEIGNFDG